MSHIHTQGASAPTIFNFNAHTVRILDKDGALWFVASDVAAALEYRDAANMARNLDVDEKGTHNLSTPAGDQEMIVISESGLYSAILRSRKPEAKRFKKWVTSEVLPAIRKTGTYSTTRKAKVELGSYLLTAGEVHHLHGVFCMVDMMRDTLRELEPPLRLLNAPIASRVFGGSHEISLFLNSLQKLRSHCDEYYRMVERRVLGH